MRSARHGALRWRQFVNDYEEFTDGKRLKFRDRFQDITANSYTLVLAWVKDDGSTQPVMVSRSVRSASSAASKSG
jgi:hypothetical protein